MNADEVRLTDHAVERYIERVKPALDEDGARQELRRLIEAAAGPMKVLPWLARNAEHQAYLEISDGIALALLKPGSKWLAVTCLTRAGVNEKRRAARREKRRGRARRRKEAAQNRKGRFHALPREERLREIAAKEYERGARELGVNPWDH